jgi:xanthine dehydrogenase accessory factor
MIGGELERRAAALAASGERFVNATVVRAARPASVRPGDRALVLADGRIEGFVGGACAEPAVRLHAARALETGEPLLLRILPTDDGGSPVEGAISVTNPCLSGGALEIFLEPHLPPARVLVLGETPVAVALARLAEPVGLEPAAWAADSDAGPSLLALIAASHGRGGEEEALRWALEHALPYVGLVASRRRGEAVLEALRAAGVAGVDRIHTPAGLDIGAQSPAEIALAILAQVIEVRRSAFAAAPPPPVEPDAEAPHARVGPAFATDPVCGMEVPVSEQTLFLETPEGRVWFCGEHCRSAWAREHAAAT